jgi:hypothetical protein
MARCSQCNKLKNLGGVTREKLLFCSDKCYKIWKSQNNPNCQESEVIDSSIGRIAGLVLIGLGGLGIIGYIIALARTGEMLFPLFPVIMFSCGIFLFKKCNGKKPQ